MVNDNKPSTLHFQGRDEREIFQFYFRQHWIRLLKPFVIVMLWSAALAIATYVIFWEQSDMDAATRHGLLIGLASVFVLVHLRFLLRIYTYFLCVVVVTDRRIHRIKKTLVSVDDHQTIDMSECQEVQKIQHGPIQNLFGFGTLIFEAQDTRLRLHFVGRIGRIYDRISRLRETARGLTPEQ